MTEAVKIPLNDAEFSYELQGSLIRRTLLPNGLRVLTEQLPGARSTALGFWVGVGSRDEQAANPSAPASLGSTHFLEHLLFKGTKTRSAYDIAEGFDRIGADHNAMTAKEFTAYHAKVRDSDVPIATTLLADMVCASVIDNTEFETERGVILEELAMAADDLADVAHEKLFEAVLPNHPLGRPIGGTPEEIKAATRNSVWQHYENHYHPQGLVIAAAGAIEHEFFVELIVKELQRAGGRWADSAAAAPLSRRARKQDISYQPVAQELVTKESEQVHLLLGAPGLINGADERFAFAIFNSVLGGGMSSRLFQEIREKRGLAYTTYSFGASYSSAGIFGMYAGCAPEKAKQVLEIARGELEKLAEYEISDAELQRAVGQLGGSAALALENSEARMGRLARAELGSGEIWDIDVSQAKIAAVTKSEVQTLAKQMLAGLNTTVAVGDIAKTQLG